MVGGIGLILGGVTMAAAIAAAVFAKRAAVATEETVRIAKEAAEGAAEALNIATRNAEAAVSQVEVARDTAKKQLRAYLGAIEERLVRFEVGALLRVNVTIKNSGQTPANHVSVRHGLCFCENEATFLHQKRQPWIEEHDPPILVGPQETAIKVLYGGAVLTQASYNRFMNGEVIGYLWTEINYLDVFDQGHTFKSASILDHVAFKEDGGIYSAHPSGSSAD